jgi:hypothetical protein
MPSIKTASQKITNFPNAFISPYGNDGVIPLYSSIPIDYKSGDDCLPCVVCGNSSIRSEVIEATGAQTSHASSGDAQITVVPIPT